MKRYQSGSEWRKWDLHVHLPGTTLNNGYQANSDGTPDWNRFCQLIHQSDVDVIGVTDYFSLNSFFVFKKHYEDLHGDSGKVFLPNLELRLTDNLNKGGESVNAHLLFPSDLTEKTAQAFLQSLKTEVNAKERKQLSCAELSSKSDFEKCTVTRDAIEAAIKDTFGRDCVYSDHLLIITSAKGDGIRPESGVKRKANIADEIDKISHGFFGNSTSAKWFLNTDRLEDKTLYIRPKPVFGGCDAHSFEELEAWLGQAVSQKNQSKDITWVKADPSFEGLQQTLIEPEHRVRIQTPKPDTKEPYKVISRVLFPDSKVFPDEIHLNPNLNSIIGSRSSGKSALLAYIAHAVNPEYTVKQQSDASNLPVQEMGPAVGKRWSEVTDIECVVEWASPEVATGSIVYIPQNSLYAISERPTEITKKIEPALFRKYDDFATTHGRHVRDIEAANTAISSAVSEWFSLASSMKDLDTTVREIGDKTAIKKTHGELTTKIDNLRKKAELTDEETQQYETLMEQINSNESRLAEIVNEKTALGPYILKTKDNFVGNVDSLTFEYSLEPELVDFPEDLEATIDAAIEAAAEQTTTTIVASIGNHRSKIETEGLTLEKSTKRLRDDNKQLIKKNEANSEIELLLGQQKVQQDLLDKINTLEKRKKKQQTAQGAELTKLQRQLDNRDKSYVAVVDAFGTEVRGLDDLIFSVETAFAPETIRELSEGFNKNASSPFIQKNRG